MNIMTKRGSLDNVVTYEHICDAISDLQNISSKYATLGSIAMVLNGESGSLEVYIANSNSEWKLLSASNGSDGGGQTANTMEMHVCSNNEYNAETGVPTIEEPAEKTLYIVPAPQSEAATGNLYNEYMYINNAWEKIGANGASTAAVNANWTAANGTSAFIENKPPVLGTLNKGNIIMNNTSRNTASGDFSTAAGYYTQATKEQAFACGLETIASGANAFVSGKNNTASGINSHAEGANTSATAAEGHAEGLRTVAGGTTASHAEGSDNSTTGACAHVEGFHNVSTQDFAHIAGTYSTEEIPTYNSSATYSCGDYVSYNNNYYICIEETIGGIPPTVTDVWQSVTDSMHTTPYVEVIGNGNTENNSNARTTDWKGNTVLNGSMYIHNGNLVIGNTHISEEQLEKLLRLIAQE